jgi:hypothetical protein
MPELMMTANAQHGIYCPVDLNEDAASRIYGSVCDSVASSLRGSAFLTMKAHFAEARERLESTTNLEPNWDTYNAEPPNETARTLARRILDSLEVISFPPTRVMPSVEGGIGLAFVEQDNRADIEVYNTGEIAAAIYSALQAPETWTVPDTERSLKTMIDRIRVHLAA